MEKRLELAKSGSATFDASGTATVVFRNTSNNRWIVKNTAVSSTSASQTACTVYKGSAMVGNQIDFTKAGNGRASDTVSELLFNNFLTVVWAGGTPGALATVTISGDEMSKALIY